MVDFDVERINLILSGLRGVRCWGPGLSYGDELELHMGDRRPYESTLLSDLMKGSWILCTQASFWVLRKGSDSITTSKEQTAQMETGIRALVDRTVTRASLDAQTLVLAVEFDDNHWLEVVPDPEDVDLYPHVCDWELFTPDEMYLGVGPGRKWVYRDSRTPL